MIPGKVSVIVPVYNGARFLNDCISSAIHQANADLEVIAVNDGSSDTSLDILNSFEPRLQVIDQENAGPAAARHRGVIASSGEFIAFLDQDDVWDENKLERQLSVFRQYPEALAVYCDHRSIDENGNVVGTSGALHHPRGSGQILKYMIQGSIVLTASLVMTRREAYDSAGGFDVNHSYWADDFDLWMRIAALGPFLYHLETLVSYRRHSHNTSGSSFENSAGVTQAYRNVDTFLRRNELHRNLWPLIREQRFRAELATAWHHRMRSQPTLASRRYCEALRLNVLSVDAWMGLAMAFCSRIATKAKPAARGNPR